MRTYLLPLYALLLLPLAGPALAVDGVLEINQTCAVQTGCFSGDVAGFPVSINGTAGRSYRLTSDLVIPSANSNGIFISTPDIAIDLGGFTIIGQACVGQTGNCTLASGSGNGVTISAIDRRGVSVRNGSIVGMGSNGVWVGEQGEVRNVRARWNRLDGIKADRGSTVADCLVFENGGRGIEAGIGSTVSGNTAYNNGADGIFAFSGSTVSGNTAYSNGAEGIEVTSGSTVSGNTVRSNGGYGLLLGFSSGYRDNVILGNSMGTVDAGVNAGGNLCDGSLTCP